MNSLSRARTTLIRRLLHTALLLVTILLVDGLLALLAMRHAQLYLLVATVVVLPVSLWLRFRFRLACVILASATLLVAASPIDVFFRTDGQGLRVRVLPASYGIACEDHARFACYGCGVPLYPVSRAVVISY